MKHRLNRKLLASLLITGLVLAGGAYALRTFQVKRNAGLLLRRAEQAEAKGDPAEAEKALQRYLAYVPGDTAALARYVLIRADRATSREARLQAIQGLEEVLRRDPDRRDVRRRLADLAMGDDVRRYSDAKTYLEELLGRSEPGDKVGQDETAPGGAELEYLLGRCSEGERKSEEAARWYAAAVGHDPARIEAAVRLAGVLRDRLERPEESDRVVDAMVAANDRSSRAHLERGLHRKRRAAAAGLAADASRALIEDSARDVARALELDPEGADVLLAASESALGRRDLEGARRHLARGLELHPRDGRLFEALAGLEMQANRPAEAAAALRRGVEVMEESAGRLGLLWTLANLLIDGGDLDGAGPVIERLRAEKLRPELLQFLEARSLFGRRRWAEARRELEPVVPLLVGQPGLAYQAGLLLGRCCEELGDHDRRLGALREAVALDPVAVPGRLDLAAALAATGKVDEAIDAYRKVADRAPGARVEAARLLVVRTLRRPEPRRDWREADRALDEAERAMPDSTEVAILRAEALAGRGGVEAARALLVEARDRQPGRADLWAALAALADRKGGPGAALPVLDEAERTLGDLAELRLARARSWVARGGAGALPALARLADGLGRFDAEGRRRLVLGLAEAHQRLGDLAGARPLVDRLVEERPTDPGLRATQFDLALQAGDEVAAGRVLGDLQAIEGADGTFWRHDEARLLIRQAARAGRGALDRGRLAEARRLLVEVAARRASWPMVPLAMAEIDDVLGDPEKAIEGYLRAIDLGERRPAAVARAVQLLNDRRRHAQAATLIRRLEEEGLALTDPQLGRLAAEAALRNKETDRARDLARRSVPAGSKDYRDHLWLGRILGAAGEPSEAEAELRRAVELAGGAPEAWVALVQFLAAAGRGPEAGAAIERARAELPKEEARWALARCLAAVGRRDEARAEFQAALAARPDEPAILRAAAAYALGDGRAPDAEALLRRLVDLKAKAPDDAAWARQLLGLLLASRGDYRHGREALELMNLADPDGETPYQPSADEPAAEVRAKARVLSLFRGRAQRRAAIRILERLAGREPLTADDQFLLAQLYHRENDWPRARQRILLALADDGENPAFLSFFIRALLDRGDADGALSWLERLERREPRRFRTVEARARWLRARGRAGEAVPLLETSARGDPKLVGPVAALLEELGQVPAAERMYGAFAAASKPPEAALALAGFLARQDRPDEALDLCEKARASCRPEAVAGAIVSVLYSAPVDEGRIRRGLGAIEAMEGLSAASRPFHLANLLSLQGRYREAEALYRQSVAQDAENNGPMINLAWLLAQTGKADEALDFAARALRLAGPTPDQLDSRAMAHLAKGRTDLAIRDLEEALAEGPTPDKYLHLAQAYLAAGRRDDATTALGKVTSLGLKMDRLHPLDGARYQRLLGDLAGR